MPFTFCHPAAVLPLNYVSKRWVSLTGLIAGSIIPDFEYFIRLRDISLYSHTWAGIFWFDLPLGTGIIFIYYGVVHRALINNLPLVLKKRVYRYKDFSWKELFKKGWLIVIVSITIGAASHVLWDKFTHQTVTVIGTISPFKKHLTSLIREIAAYYLLWAVSSLIGGLTIMYALYQLPADNKVKRTKGNILFWVSIGGFTFSVFTLMVLLMPYLLEYNIGVPFISAFFLSLLITSTWYKYNLNDEHA